MNTELQRKAKEHLWMHFTRQSTMASSDVPVIVKGEGHHIWDSTGKRYIDGLAGLFVVNAGHGRRRLAEAAAKQVVDEAMLVAGGASYFSSNELSRLYRDVLAGMFHPSDPESAHSTAASAWLGPLES